jgi:hypothetical protein
MLRRGNSATSRALVSALVVVSSIAAVAADDLARTFPEPRPANRAEAVQVLCRGTAVGACVHQLMSPAARSLESPAMYRSRQLLTVSETDAEVWLGPHATRFRYSVDARSADRIDVADADNNRVPDLLDTVADALERARRLLGVQLELKLPALAEVQLAELGDRAGGYVVPGDKGVVLVLEGSPPGGAAAVARSAVRQYAYATALELGVAQTEWAEAFAAWVESRVEGFGADAAAVASERLRELGAGLLARRQEGAAGNAIWFSFLDQAYGLASVRVTIEELAASSSPAAALDRALRRASALDLESAFREFHVWAVLTGARADGRHFDFASRVEAPPFAATANGVMALSLEREPPLGPLGAAQIRLVPQQASGGLRVRFEGEFGARWDADLIVLGRGGEMHRVALPLGPEGRGEVAVPLNQASELWLLVRQTASDDGTPRHYTYSTHHERDFPFSLSAIRAERAENGRGIVVGWDTAVEQDLVGFNILRRRTDVGEAPEQVVNPVWVPALGVSGDETSYRFVDPTARPDAEYTYRVQGITRTGLSAYSDTVAVTPSN